MQRRSITGISVAKQLATLIANTGYAEYSVPCEYADSGY